MREMRKYFETKETGATEQTVGRAVAQGSGWWLQTPTRKRKAAGPDVTSHLEKLGKESELSPE